MAARGDPRDGDAWGGEIERAALRDEKRWGAEFRAYFAQRGEFNTHVEEVAYVQDWIERRWASIEENLR